jgi:anthranilate phosphoribosyltransferase
MMSLDLKSFLDQLIAGRDLQSEQAYQIASAIARDEIDHHQLAALLALLAARGENAAIVHGFAKAMREVAISVEVKSGPVVDIVGTGGDGHDTVNISTAAALVAAACGARVAKNGSVSVSGKSGAADVLRALGVAMLPPEDIADCVEDCGIAFMFAPMFHPALAKVINLRRALRIRTIFNILGPLLNPAGAKRLVLGVFAPRLLRVYAEAAAALHVERALVRPH